MAEKISTQSMRSPDRAITILDAAQAADHVRLSASTLAKLRLQGSGPRFLKLGRSIRYSTEDLDEWLFQNSRHSTSEGSSPTKRKPRKAGLR